MISINTSLRPPQLSIEALKTEAFYELALGLKAKPGQSFPPLHKLVGLKAKDAMSIQLPKEHPNELYEQMLREKQEEWDSRQAEEHRANVQAQMNHVQAKIDHMNDQHQTFADAANRAQESHSVHKQGYNFP
jgi:hypothetical protein